MNKEEKYKVILVICITFFIVFLFYNYFFIRQKFKYNTKLSNLEQIEKSKEADSRSIECSDIVRFLQDEQGIEEIKFNNKKSSEVTEIEVKNNWDVLKTTDVFKKIQNKNMSTDIKKLYIEKGIGDGIMTQINMKVQK
ncbi:hypothetical protein HBE96_01465 [Clostridium sp. P21]|uniref:Uncharacterized protein n=1 Tax=Clostridium muellerianum TaxID=2716538 RepID=A0A7Y0EDF0_9CLOT|nr:hypothetical protein [Clostridium muellerianum]NMM61387.1 hypothetical protein [Clostridium muellerianum]